MTYPLLMNPKPGKLVAPFLAILTGLGAFSFVLYLESVPGDNDDAIHLAYPVQGEWNIVTGGRSGLTNYHHDNPASQNYAVDMVRDKGETEGEKVYAPIGGVIMEAINDRDQGSPEADGNIIVIQADNGVEICLAHLQYRSVLVQKGDRVATGQEIAKCGSTGSAEKAHLHIHAQRAQESIPMLFGKDFRFLLRNDTIGNL